MIYNEGNLQYCVDRKRKGYEEWRDPRLDDGFRTISLALAGPASDPSYSAVMVRYAQPFRTWAFSRLKKGELDRKIAELEEEAHPYLIAATGSGNDVVYAAVFREVTQMFTTGIGHIDEGPALDISAQEFIERNGRERDIGRILISVDTFGTPSNARYCAVWGPNPENIVWNADGINEKGEDRHERFEAMKSIGARPALVAMTPSGGVALVYLDRRLKHSRHTETNMDGEKFSRVLGEQREADRFPICIGTTFTDKLRYSAIFAKSDEILPRTFRIRGPQSFDPRIRTQAAAIDDYMEKYVRDRNYRGAALAIVEGTRLVYAKGYTFAEPEPHYRDILPTTLFRMASVAKTFCAMAVWKALADDGVHTRSSRMQDILQLTHNGGLEPVDPKFAKIELGHLLESSSGIDQKLVRGHVHDMAKDSNKPAQPLTIEYLAENIAAQLMLADPGETTVYGRTDYFLLSLVAMKLAGVDKFYEALKKLLLDPLHMTRTRLSRSRIEDRGSDEALHHPPDLATDISAVHDDRRIVPLTYGYDNYEVYLGAGGISSAVVDMARLGAMLNCRVNNPLFSTAVLDELLNDVVAATLARTGHGYHGFDEAEDKGSYIELSKGGSLDGVWAGLWGRTGRRFIAIARNGPKVEGESQPYLAIEALAQSIDWGTDDFFPAFDMPSLG